MSLAALGRRFSAAFLRVICTLLTLIQVLSMLVLAFGSWAGILGGEDVRTGFFVVLFALVGLVLTWVLHIARWGGSLLVDEIEGDQQCEDLHARCRWGDFIKYDFLSLAQTSVMFVFVVMGVVALATGMVGGWNGCRITGVSLSLLLVLAALWVKRRLDREKAA